MKNEKSCGAVLYKEVNGIKHFCIIEQTLGHYCFPKGHVKPGESESDTALREIFEETNLHAILDTSFRRVLTYSPAPKVMKDVIYFAGRITIDDSKPDNYEVRSITFLPLEQALAKLTYQSDRDLLIECAKYLGLEVH